MAIKNRELCNWYYWHTSISSSQIIGKYPNTGISVFSSRGKDNYIFYIRMINRITGIPTTKNKCI